MPRGIENKNPGNLRRGSDAWQGLAEQQTDAEFYQFDSPPYGIRALARVLLNYADTKKAPDGTPVNTVRKIIERWAPPSENPTAAYIAAVCQATQFEADRVLDLHQHAQLKPLVLAIIRQENGVQPYDDAVIDKGLVLAGVEPEKPVSLAASRTVQGGAAAAGGGAIATAAATLAAVEPAIPVLKQIAEFVRTYMHETLIIVGMLALMGGLFAIYARWTDRKRGIS